MRESTGPKTGGGITGYKEKGEPVERQSRSTKIASSGGSSDGGDDNSSSWLSIIGRTFKFALKFVGGSLVIILVADATNAHKGFPTVSIIGLSIYLWRHK